jgi:hypothetical protein
VATRHIFEKGVPSDDAAKNIVVRPFTKTDDGVRSTFRVYSLNDEIGISAQRDRRRNELPVDQGAAIVKSADDDWGAAGAAEGLRRLDEV